MKYQLVVKPYRKEDNKEKIKLFPNHFVVEFTNLFEFDAVVTDYAEKFVEWYRKSDYDQVQLYLYHGDTERSGYFMTVAKNLNDAMLQTRWRDTCQHVFQLAAATYKHAIQDTVQGELFKLRVETVNRKVILREEQGIMMTFRHGEFLNVYRGNIALVYALLSLNPEQLRTYRVLITHPYEMFLNRASVIRYKEEDNLDTRLSVLDKTIRRMLESIDESMDACYRDTSYTNVWVKDTNA